MTAKKNGSTLIVFIMIIAAILLILITRYRTMIFAVDLSYQKERSEKIFFALDSLFNYGCMVAIQKYAVLTEQAEIPYSITLTSAPQDFNGNDEWLGRVVITVSSSDIKVEAWIEANNKKLGGISGTVVKQKNSESFQVVQWQRV